MELDGPLANGAPEKLAASNLADIVSTGWRPGFIPSSVVVNYSFIQANGYTQAAGQVDLGLTWSKIANSAIAGVVGIQPANDFIGTVTLATNTSEMMGTLVYTPATATGVQAPTTASRYMVFLTVGYNGVISSNNYSINGSLTFNR